LRFDLGADLPSVEADATQLRQLVMNLITNASDALGDGDGGIRVATRAAALDRSFFAAARVGGDLPPGRYVVLEVVDTGIGMDEATLERMFDPFYTTKEQGRGLGLAAALGAVLMDLTMPRMSGEEALRRIREIAPAVPVIVTSGYTAHDPALSAVAQLASGFVQKPYRAQILLGKVREILAPRQTPGG
jgi:CheY-like chemotaxis protein